jgi:hypothetical protein
MGLNKLRVHPVGRSAPLQERPAGRDLSSVALGLRGCMR